MILLPLFNCPLSCKQIKFKILFDKSGNKTLPIGIFFNEFYITRSMLGTGSIPSPLLFPPSPKIRNYLLIRICSGEKKKG